MTENLEGVCVCVCSETGKCREELAVGGAQSWPGWGNGCGQGATSEEAPCPPPPPAPLE